MTGSVLGLAALAFALFNFRKKEKNQKKKHTAYVFSQPELIIPPHCTISSRSEKHLLVLDENGGMNGYISKHADRKTTYGIKRNLREVFGVKTLLEQEEKRRNRYDDMERC